MVSYGRRRIRLADSLSIADLHRVIQLVMGWADDPLRHFCIPVAEITAPLQCPCHGSASVARTGFSASTTSRLDWDGMAVGDAGFAERRHGAVRWEMADDVDAVVRRVAPGAAGSGFTSPK